MNERINIIPEVETVVGFLRTEDEYTTMTVATEEWAEYLQAWWNYQDAVAKINKVMVVSKIGDQSA